MPRPPTYGRRVIAALVMCWAVPRPPTGKRLAPMLPVLVPMLRRDGELDLTDAAAELTRATGREIRYLPVSAEQYAEAAGRAGVPAEEVEPLTELFARVLDGHNAHLTDDVELVLGRRARDFADYAQDAAATGVWSR